MKSVTRIMCAFTILLVAVLSARADTAAILGYCSLGGTQATTQGIKSTNYQLGIVPKCKVAVYLTGTTTLATIYADGNNTVLQNPFTATVTGSWLFFAAINQGYDVTLSGGTSPNAYTSPVTLNQLFPAQQVINGSSGNIASGAPYQIGAYSPTSPKQINPTNMTTDATWNNLFVPGQVSSAQLVATSAGRSALPVCPFGTNNALTVVGCQIPPGAIPGLGPDGQNGIVVAGNVNAVSLTGLGTVTPTVNSLRSSTASATGPLPNQVIAFLGNSLVQVDIGLITEFCTETGILSVTSASSPNYTAGHQCRPATNITVDGSGNVVLAVPNGDGYFQSGGRFTAYGNALVDGGCLFDSYVVTSANATTITFATAGSGATCAALASTPITSNNLLLTTSVQKFGINGATLDAWYAASGNYGFTAYKAWVQSAIAAGQTPGAD